MRAASNPSNLKQTTTFITHPLNLMGIQPPVGTFFIDARILWLHPSPLHLQDNVMPNAHIVVYYSAHLPLPAAPCIWLKNQTFWRRHQH